MKVMAEKRLKQGKKLTSRLLEVFSILYKMYGPQHWWPADSFFEVVVGAILTQNTNWSNVEKAILNLKREDLLHPLKLHNISANKLAALIRPSGYYNIKAKRLKNFLDFLFFKYNGKLFRMKCTPLSTLREEILSVNGIGPETADSILLYALDKPIFVIDAYTRRITKCLGLTRGKSKYDDLQALFMQNLPHDTSLFNEYHALIVAHSKGVCRISPDCEKCVFHNDKKGAR